MRKRRTTQTATFASIICLWWRRGTHMWNGNETKLLRLGFQTCFGLRKTFTNMSHKYKNRKSCFCKSKNRNYMTLSLPWLPEFCEKWQRWENLSLPDKLFAILVKAYTNFCTLTANTSLGESSSCIPCEKGSVPWLEWNYTEVSTPWYIDLSIPHLISDSLSCSTKINCT